MPRTYMPTDVFEVAAASVAQLHALQRGSIVELANGVWAGYQRRVVDDGVCGDLAMAASEGLQWLERRHVVAVPDFMHHFKWYCACFGPDGHYIRKGFFDGLISRRAAHDPLRVTRYLSKLKRYYFGLTSGQPQYPPAPDGWSLENRKMWNEEVARLTNFL